MSDLLLLQSIESSPDGYEGILDMTLPVTRRYAAACGAHYELFVGRTDPEVSASWNRVSRTLAAFRDGYRKVAWLDLDTLVVKLDDSIFEGTDDTPFHTVRIVHPGDRDEYGHIKYGTPDVDDARFYIENDGVIVYVNDPRTIEALEEFWSVRREPKAGYQQGWFDPYVRAHPDVHRPLDPKYNWFDWGDNIRDNDDPNYPRVEDAVILAWHAYIGGDRKSKMRQEFAVRWPGLL